MSPSQAHLPKQERCCTGDSHGIIEGAEVFNNNTTKKGVNVSFMSSVARQFINFIFTRVPVGRIVHKVYIYDTVGEWAGSR